MIIKELTVPMDIWTNDKIRFIKSIRTNYKRQRLDISKAQTHTRFLFVGFNGDSPFEIESTEEHANMVHVTFSWSE
jgi:hypothetical protein